MSNHWKSKCSLEILKQRAFLLQKIREYFFKEKVLEVETPILSSAGNTDANIESFTSESINSDFSTSYLRTSPEFPLKRLLCNGVGDVFEIGKVFRKGEISKSHNSEFTMLEWYRVGFDYQQLIEDVNRLFIAVFSSFDLQLLGNIIICYNDCFKQFLNIDLNNTSTLLLNNICSDYNYSGSYLTTDEALDYLFAIQIQPNLNKNMLTFVTLYPANQAALAQINPHDMTTSLRFEVFYQGYELGNGYQELTDSKELLQRFERENQSRDDNKQVQIDSNLISAMNGGLPNCSGIAVGVDRLLMALLQQDDISKVMSFDFKNA